MARFAEMDDIGGTFSSLGLFIVTVVLGIGAHGLLVLPLLFFIITRSNPYKFLKGMTAAMTTAFGTDSRLIHCLSRSPLTAFENSHVNDSHVPRGGQIEILPPDSLKRTKSRGRSVQACLKWSIWGPENCENLRGTPYPGPS